MDGYKLQEPHQDVRGLPLYAAAGTKVGMIDELLVDEVAERVAAVRLEDGRVVPVEPLEIRTDRVVDHGAGHVHDGTARTYDARTRRA